MEVDLATPKSKAALDMLNQVVSFGSMYAPLDQIFGVGNPIAAAITKARNNAQLNSLGVNPMLIATQNQIKAEDYTGDTVHEFLKDYHNQLGGKIAVTAIPGFTTVQEVEDLPGTFKNFSIEYPVKEYRTMSVRAKSLKEALIKADRQLKARNNKWPTAANRIGDFRIRGVIFSNFRDKINQWSAWLMRLQHLPLKKVDSHFCAGHMIGAGHKPVEVPDGYWQPANQ